MRRSSVRSSQGTSNTSERALQPDVANAGATAPFDHRGGGAGIGSGGGLDEQACVGELFLYVPVGTREAERTRCVSLDGEGEHRFLALVNRIAARRRGGNALAHHRRELVGFKTVRGMLGDRAADEQVVD